MPPAKRAPRKPKVVEPVLDDVLIIPTPSEIADALAEYRDRRAAFNEANMMLLAARKRLHDVLHAAGVEEIGRAL